MKILMLTWEYPPRVVGGISRVVYDLSRTLLKDGHDVTVVTYKDGDAPEFEDDKGVKVYRVENYMINPNNFLWMFMFIPYAIMSVVFSVGFWSTIGFLCGWMLLIIMNSLWYMLVRTLINDRIWWWVLPVIVYAAVFAPPQLAFLRPASVAVLGAMMEHTLNYKELMPMYLRAPSAERNRKLVEAAQNGR